MHLDQAADPLARALGGVQEGVARLHLAGVDADERELADEGIGHDLEHEPGERGAVIARTLDRLPGVRIDGDGSRNVEGRGEVGDDRVEHGLHALVLERGAADHGEELQGDGGPTDAGLQLLGGDLFALQELVGEVIVDFRDLLDEMVAGELGLVEHVGGDLFGLVLGAHGLVFVSVRLHRDQVDHPDELVLGADGQLDGDRGLGGETVDHHVDAALEVGAHPVHLVDEGDAGNVVLVGLAPDRFRLGLHAGHRVEHRDRPVEDAQGPFDLGGEVDVARSVDDVDPVLFPEAGGGRGGDGDPALLLLLHPVHGGGAVVDFTDLVIDSGVEKNPLGRGGLARVDMRGNPDVAGLFEGGGTSSHDCFSGVLKEGRAITSDSGRRPCWPRPSCERRPSSSWPRHEGWTRPAARSRAC